MIDGLMADARKTAIALNKMLDELEAHGVRACVIGEPMNRTEHHWADPTRVRLTLTQPDHRAAAPDAAEKTD